MPAGAPTADAPVKELDRIQVLGSYAGSLSAALRAKRYADSVVDVIAAEDIGKLPAQNVAEALQRVPGVSIVRDRGEGVYVRVRGLGPNFQVTTLNGQTMAVNENVRTSGQTGRQFRYDTLPAELVSGLEVIKSPTADLDEGAIGGIVNVRTFRPLELGKTLTNVSLESSQAQRPHANDPRVSGLFNWVNADGSFGLLISGAYAQRSLRQDRVNEVSWDYYRNGVPGAPGAYYAPTGLRPTLELEHRERSGVAASLQWKPSAAWETNLDLLYARQTVHYDEYSLGVGFDSLAKLSDLRVAHGGITGFDYRNGQVQISRETSGITDDDRSARLVQHLERRSLDAGRGGVPLAGAQLRFGSDPAHPPAQRHDSVDARGHAASRRRQRAELELQQRLRSEQPGHRGRAPPGVARNRCARQGGRAAVRCQAHARRRRLPRPQGRRQVPQALAQLRPRRPAAQQHRRGAFPGRQLHRAAGGRHARRRQRQPAAAVAGAGRIHLLGQLADCTRPCPAARWCSSAGAAPTGNA
ncbi:hypothetical protein XTPLMG730_0021 [Xanthomonas translucens pv. phlei]|uniref:TonB-dependent receptor plug domain-containing protein n=1 Tax=Xanthomonas graminis pv. phlei TaxID=487906 RepID=A0A0K2ZBS3_9XANT|nr:hypothetical protein XTPLMG730_0021 [Xanthomonas translucens pv. phlei]